MPVYRGARNTLFTSACLKTLDQYGSPLGYSFQLVPRGGLVQGFDFQYGNKGALLQYWPNYANIASLIESRVKSTGCRSWTNTGHVDPAGQDAAAIRAPEPRQVGGARGRDLWWRPTSFVYGGIRKHYGICESVVRPELGKSYSTRVVGDTCA